jgi:hypothetical protein
MTDRSKKPSWDALVPAVQRQNVAKHGPMLMQRFVSAHADATKLGMGDA